MKDKLRKLIAITTLCAVILTTSAFGFRANLDQPFSVPMASAGYRDNFKTLNGAVHDSGNDELSFSSTLDDELPVRTEMASGLTTTTFDTLVGTVTVNMPDDIAAGDTISGTVVSEAKGKTVDDQAKNQDELNGFVVEVAKQSPPAPKEGGNLIDFCKDPAKAETTHLKEVCNKWSIPDGITKVPVVLKNKDGKTVGKSELPVAPKGKPGDAPVDVFTPAVGQAGKPMSVKGPFDGDFANTVVKVGNFGTKFLASSPRKVVVESPRDLKGPAEITVDHKGKTVARCSYRNISVKLAADKLNLIKGEHTSLTVTLAGLIGLLSPVSVQLSNKSPGTVTMSGGEMQTIIVDPKEVNGDIFTAKRTLTGVQAGGFAITAVVDPQSLQSDCKVPGQTNAVPPPNGKGTTPDGPNGPPPGNPPMLPDPPQPPSPDPPQPTRPGEARYRVTLNGFFVGNPTVEGLRTLDGRGDEVFVISHVGRVASNGVLTRIMWGVSPSVTMGETPVNTVRAGSVMRASGGLQRGDGFPTDTPWTRGPRLNAITPPASLFEGPLRTDNRDAIFIIPTIWEWDGVNDQDLTGDYGSELNEATSGFAARIVSDIIQAPPPLSLGSFLKTGAEWTRINNALYLAYGVPQDRPIGMELNGSRYGYNAKVLILTNAAAEFISRTDFGKGPGIVPVQYVDHPSLGGDYTMYLQVERVDTSPCAESITGGRFTGTAELTTTRREAPGPYGSNVNLTVDFTECRGQVRITNFPPLTSDSLTALGPNTSTMTMTAGGTGRFIASGRRIEMPVTLGLQNSLSIFGNSTIPLTLSGTADAEGNATLRGTGTFSGGQLGSHQGTVVVTGRFSPRP